MTTLTIPATQVRKNLFDLLEKLINPAIQITITYRGEPRAVLVNAEEFDSRQETLEIMADKELMADIKAAEAEYKQGEYLTFEEVFGKTPTQVLKDKGKTKYQGRKNDRISNRHSQKSRQTAK